MQHLTAVLTRVSGLALVVVLSAVLAVLGSAPALGAPGDPDPVGVWPLRPEPEVVEGFDPPDDPWGAGHRGVDLLGSPGQQVHAALPGRVSFAGMLAGRGVVVVDHGDTRTTYEPVAAGVSVGDAVAGRRADRPARRSPAPTASRAPACTGAGCAARPTSTRSTSSAPARCGCCRCGGTSRSPGRPTSVDAAVPYAGWRPLLEVVDWLG